MAYVDSILGAAEREAASSQGSDRLAADKDTFLKLLVAQLTNQDPLDPTDDKEFITQLAQFTSLEQLQGINSGVESLNDTMYQTQMLSAATYIGKSIVATGDQITKLSDDDNIYTTDLIYTLDEDVARGEIHIMDANGNLKFSDTITSKNAGSYVYQWKGYDSGGKECSDGNYTALVAFFDENDKTIMATTQFVGQVTSTLQKDGVYYLVLAGGREVELTNVNEVYQGATDSGSGSSSTAADQAADYMAAAYIAADQAAKHEALALESTDAETAKKHTNNAITSYNSANDAATSAETVAKTAKENAEELKTSSSLKIYEEAQASATKAREYADAAKTSMDNAKLYAEGLGATFG